MKKIFKSKLLFFVLGAIMFGSIGIAFAYSIFAQDVGFTPSDSDWDVDNVKDALDDMRSYLEIYNNRGYTNLSNPIPTSIDDPNIISSSYNAYAVEYAYYAFDKVNNTFWTSNPDEPLPQYLGWDFKELVAVYDFTITNRYNTIDTTVGQFTLQGYRNGIWEDIQSYNHTERARGGSTKYRVDNPRYYYKYQLKFITEGVKNANYIQISQLDFNYIKPNFRE